MVRAIFGHHNIGTMEDQPYRDKRGLIHHHFGQPKIKGYQSRIEEVINNWLDGLTEGPLDLGKAVGQLSCDITGSIFVHQDQSSIKIKEASRRLGDLITLVNRTAFTPYPMWFKRLYEKVASCCRFRIPFLPEPLQPEVWNRQRECREEYYQELEKFLHLLLEEKQGEGVDPTLFHSLLERHREAIESSETFPEEFKTDIAAIFFAGQDTTTSLIIWLMIELDRHPEIKARLLQDPDEEFVIAMIMETLRLDPPSSATIRNVRIVQPGTSVELGPYQLEDGAHVLVYNYIVNRSPDYWGDDADQWRPERMLNFYKEHGKWPTEVKEACFSTFIDGQHKCPGRRIVVPVVVRFLKLFFQRFDYTLDPSCDLSPKIEIVTLPKDSLRIQLTRRAV